ncbi:hypothetical protein F5B20DRAFT_213017 [Whalleya microplaca]|nr:hypothetical protein F5B20DRAFT_213017 [Whalleya microplaca]
MGQICCLNMDYFFVRPKRHHYSHKKSNAKPKRKEKRKHHTMANNQPAGGPQPPLGYRPPPPSPMPQGRHDLKRCRCEHCAWVRQWQVRNAKQERPGAAENDRPGSPPQPPRAALGNKKNRAKPDAEPPSRQSSAPAAFQPPVNIFVYPTSEVHLILPVVNHTASMRAQYGSPMPVCHMAVAPGCAKPQDFEKAMAPAGSGHIVLVRLLVNNETLPLNRFQTATEIRDAALQLEVWDDPELASSRKGSVAVAGESRKPSGTVIVEQKKDKGKKKEAPPGHFQWDDAATKAPEADQGFQGWGFGGNKLDDAFDDWGQPDPRGK